MTDTPVASGDQPGSVTQPVTPSPAAPAWMNDLPDDLKGNANLAKLPDVAALAKEHVNAQALLGRKGMILPTEKDPPESWDGVWKAIGRPDKPDGYQFTKPEGFDGYSDEFAGKFRDAAHKAGLSAKQAAGLHDWWVEGMKGMAGESAKAIEARDAEVAATIQKEWGSNAPAKMELVRRAATALGAKDEALGAIEKSLGNFAALQLLATLGENLREGTLEGKAAGGVSVAQANAELAKQNAQMTDPKSPLMDKFHPEHASLMKRREELFQIVAGQG